MVLRAARVKVNETNKGAHTVTSWKESHLYKEWEWIKSHHFALMRSNYGNQVWVWTDGLKAEGFGVDPPLV